MKYIIWGMMVVFWDGCSKNVGTEKKQDRYLYFTSNFPDSVYWETMTTFENKRDSYFCQDFSMGHGGWVQSTKYIHDTLKVLNDTLKIPLFWNKWDFCGWEFFSTSLSLRALGIEMRRIYIYPENSKSSRILHSTLLPNVLTYFCKRQIGVSSIQCEEVTGNNISEFRLADSLSTKYFRLDLNGF